MRNMKPHCVPFWHKMRRIMREVLGPQQRGTSTLKPKRQK
jgi:hypothetical protein